MEILYRYRDYLSTYSITTKETYYECIKLYLKYLEYTYGKVNPIVICNVKQSDIYNYLAYMDNLSKASKKVRLYAVKNFYKFLKINVDLFEDIKLYNSNIKMPYCLSSSQCRLLIDYYKDKRNRLIIYMFLSTGIRLSELASIEVKDINLEDKYILIKCKGSIERKVLINEKCKKMIQEYESSSSRLFNLSKTAIYQIVKKAMKELGFKGSPHTLRHSIATIMYEQTHDIRLVQEFLGHKSIISTQIYTHISNSRVKEAVENNPLANYGGNYEN